MSKPIVTLATCAALPQLAEDDAPLPDALAARGIEPRIAVWDDPDVDWSAAGVVVMRSVNDYATRRDEFVRWAESVPRLVNHADVVRWNTDKHYMIELEKRGMPTIPTVWLEPERNLSKHQVHTRFPASGDFVVKPAVSSGSHDTGRYTAVDAKSRQEAIGHAMDLLAEGRSVMVQRYLESVDQRGETALIFMNGLVSHAVEKDAMLHGPFRRHSDAPAEVAHAREATDAEWRLGEEARVAIHSLIKERMGRDEQLTYCRIDVVEGEDGGVRVMEVSLVDSSLYLSTTPGAVDNFADAIAVRAFW
ncbi:ATP-grasp domain-containing protein [Georgenia subflava]|uniref:Glutathione synthetase n=1 Tax=Georgenia subflava TaxID=1622177 RepID=A0A6N7EMZ5_9MICO|nr:glutathione synthetase [Georgenia subflava]MPV37516.1 glutathione synthetase [Georgenia subflava]